MLKAWRIFADGAARVERNQRHRFLWAVLWFHIGTLFRWSVKLRRCHTRSNRHETGEGAFNVFWRARFIDEWLFKATRTPTRDENGVDLLCKYYNLLYYAERRFFPADRNIGLYFEWYDSLTGRQQWDEFSHNRVSVTQIAANTWHSSFVRYLKFCTNFLRWADVSKNYYTGESINFVQHCRALHANRREERSHATLRTRWSLRFIFESGRNFPTHHR